LLHFYRQQVAATTFLCPNPHPLKSFTSLCSLYVAADLYDSGYAVMLREGAFFILVSPVRISFYTGSV
jgi:hypothetical protein